MAQRFNRLPREAVVLVHGIGEQQPMNTLLSFQRSLAHGHVTFGAPDDVRQRTDQRKLKVTWNQSGRVGRSEWTEDTRERRESNSDFFELYWAYQFRDTKLAHVTSWLKPLVTRRRRSVHGARLLGPSSRWAGLARFGAAVLMVAAGLAAVHGAYGADWAQVGLASAVAVVLLGIALGFGLLFTVRMLLLAGIAATVAFAVTRRDDLVDGSGGFVASLVGVFAIPAITTFVVGGLTKSLGDAGRYLTNSPDNVQANEEIRREGVDLLHRLHEVREPSGRYRYDRVIVVGHSLGSVIAYDAIRHLWVRRHKDMNLPPDGSSGLWTDTVRAVEVAGQALEGGEPGALERFQAAQHQLYRLLRDIESTPSVGRPSTARWIISDLVTLGSPLAYADLLLASSSEDLARRREERLLASCPPNPQRSAVAARRRPYRFGVTGSQPATRLHHAAVFAPVRWTNVYFAHDLIGGPVAGQLGPGVRDIDLGGGSWFGWFLLSNPHSNYWKPPAAGVLQAVARQRDVARSARSLEILKALICRPPSVYVRLEQPLSPEEHAALSRFLVERAAEPSANGPLSGDPLPRATETRVFVQDGTTPRVGVWVPVTGAPAKTVDDAALPVPGRIRLAWSPDLLTPPDDAVEDAEEGADDE